MRIPDPETLYHYTCGHAHVRLGEAGELVPAAELDPPLHGVRVTFAWSLLSWMTDMGEPLREPLGLTRNYATGCDRLSHRYIVEEGEVAWWPAVRRMFPASMRHALEASLGVRPAHWWIGWGPVAVRLDLSWRGSLVA